MENQKIGSRLEYIDTVKGIGILFVVYTHVNYTPLPLSLIYSFHMPLFFILSGMLFSRDRYTDFGAFLRRRLQTLMLPYLVVCLVSLAGLFVLERCLPELYDRTREEYISYFCQIFLAQGSKGMLNVPMWFVPCLFAVEIMYYFLAKLEISVRIPACMALAALGWLLESGLLAFDNTVLPWTLDSALFALGFYAAGNMAFPAVKRGVERIRDHRHRRILCMDLILIGVVLWLPLALLNGKISLGSRVLGNGILLFLTGVFGTVALFGLGILLEKCRFLRFCGRNSFYIMAVHFMIRGYVVQKLYLLLEIPMYDRKDAAQTVVPFFLVLMISLALTVLIDQCRRKMKRQ